MEKRMQGEFGGDIVAADVSPALIQSTTAPPLGVALTGHQHKPFQ